MHQNDVRVKKRKTVKRKKGKNDWRYYLNKMLHSIVL